MLLLFTPLYSDLEELGEKKDVVPYNYNDDVLHNYIPTACKFISIMSVVTVISVIAAISQNYNPIAFAPKKENKVM